MSYANVITGHIGHFLVRMSRLTFAEGLFCYLFVYMSHTDVPTGYFFPFFVHKTRMNWYFRPLAKCPIKRLKKD